MHVNVSLLSNLVLLGDFNVNIVDSDHPLFSCLLSMSSSLCLTQVVSAGNPGSLPKRKSQ